MNQYLTSICKQRCSWFRRLICGVACDEVNDLILRLEAIERKAKQDRMDALVQSFRERGVI